MKKRIASRKYYAEYIYIVITMPMIIYGVVNWANKIKLSVTVREIISNP